MDPERPEFLKWKMEKRFSSLQNLWEKDIQVCTYFVPLLRRCFSSRCTSYDFCSLTQDKCTNNRCCVSIFVLFSFLTFAFYFWKFGSIWKLLTHQLWSFFFCSIFKAFSSDVLNNRRVVDWVLDVYHVTFCITWDRELENEFMIFSFYLYRNNRIFEGYPWTLICMTWTFYLENICSHIQKKSSNQCGKLILLYKNSIAKAF